jgi:hypothetical protein
VCCRTSLWPQRPRTAETLPPTSPASPSLVPVARLSGQGPGISVPVNDWAILAVTLIALHSQIPKRFSGSPSKDKHSQVPDSNPSHGGRLKGPFSLRNRANCKPLSKSLRAESPLEDPLSANLQLPFYIPKKSPLFQHGYCYCQ